jgi:hypothetical protein
MYLDAQYLRKEYEGQLGIADAPPLHRLGWGHSTVEAAIETAWFAGARQLHLGHHEPTRTDDELDALERYAQEYLRQLQRGQPATDYPRVELAREGISMTI